MPFLGPWLLVSAQTPSAKPLPPITTMKRLDTHRAAMTGIHGVSSSEWFPISQSVSGKSISSPGVMAAS